MSDRYTTTITCFVIAAILAAAIFLVDSGFKSDRMNIEVKKAKVAACREISEPNRTLCLKLI